MSPKKMRSKSNRKKSMRSPMRGHKPGRRSHRSHARSGRRGMSHKKHKMHNRSIMGGWILYADDADYVKAFKDIGASNDEGAKRYAEEAGVRYEGGMPNIPAGQGKSFYQNLNSAGKAAFNDYLNALGPAGYRSQALANISRRLSSARSAVGSAASSVYGAASGAVSAVREAASGAGSYLSNKYKENFGEDARNNAIVKQYCASPFELGQNLTGPNAKNTRVKMRVGVRTSQLCNGNPKISNLEESMAFQQVNLLD
jgi:hypothetical protein